MMPWKVSSNSGEQGAGSVGWRVGGGTEARRLSHSHSFKAEPQKHNKLRNKKETVLPP